MAEDGQEVVSLASRADAALSEAAFVHREDLSAEKRLLRKGAMDVWDHQNVAPDVVARLVIYIWPPQRVQLTKEINDQFNSHTPT